MLGCLFAPTARRDIGQQEGNPPTCRAKRFPKLVAALSSVVGVDSQKVAELWEKFCPLMTWTLVGLRCSGCPSRIVSMWSGNPHSYGQDPAPLNEATLRSAVWEPRIRRTILVGRQHDGVLGCAGEPCGVHGHACARARGDTTSRHGTNVPYVGLPRRMGKHPALWGYHMPPRGPRTRTRRGVERPVRGANASTAL